MGGGLRQRLAHATPFYYGWIIFIVSALTSYSSRPVMAVATLSVFVTPMTQEFNWSRGLFSGAVSLGGLCAVFISPVVGRLIDRYGSGLMIASTSLVVGVCAVGLSGISHPGAFYALYVPGRMAFAGPLELGTSTAISNWFIRRRPLALALFSVTQGTGLSIMPLVAQVIISGWDWRTAWIVLGIFTLAVGVVPQLLLMARRPEDMGLEPDPAARTTTLSIDPAQRKSATANRAAPLPVSAEVNFTPGEAIRTRAFWLLAIFSAAGFMVQAGVSLHQAPHYINEGLSGPLAALTASSFAFSQVPGGLLWSALARRFPLRFLLAASGLAVSVGALGTAISSTLVGGIPAAIALGVGVGGLHLLLRLTWADYYGRAHLGSIRGLTLPVQIAGQAVGPIFAGVMFDVSGNYYIPFLIFAVSALAAAVMALAAAPPRKDASLWVER